MKQFTRVIRKYVFVVTITTISLSFFSHAIEAHENALEAYDSNKISSEYKKNEQELLLESAIKLIKEQEQEKAFTAFLKALSLSLASSDETTNIAISEADKQLYDECLPIYLGLKGNIQQNTPRAIQEKIEAIALLHEDYYLSRFLLAASYANQGRFSEFFPLFYSSYQHLPKHYLAYKTKAALHLKLMEKIGAKNEREKQRLFIFENLEMAMKEYPQDPTIYKMLVALTNEENKANIIEKYIRKIITENIVIPRIDILFYVQQAINHEQINLAQEFINKAKEWYNISKVINASQELLDRQQMR